MTKIERKKENMVCYPKNNLSYMWTNGEKVSIWQTGNELGREKCPFAKIVNDWKP